MKRLACTLALALGAAASLQAQLRWTNVDSFYSPLPKGVHVYKTTDSLGGKPNIAFYLSADLKNRELAFDAVSNNGFRYTPDDYFVDQGRPLAVVNCTFFEYARNSNLNAVISSGKMLAYNSMSSPARGQDTLTYWHSFFSSLGIDHKRNADVAWLYTDSASRTVLAAETPVPSFRDSMNFVQKTTALKKAREAGASFKPWRVVTAVGGGPALVQDGEVRISNDLERKFGGKAIDDRHPRTAMGYTRKGQLIILVIEGRHAGTAEGATLTQEAQIFHDLGAEEALNLDGGGSSCLLVNGRETITPSEKGEQRPVPAVFLIRDLGKSVE